MKDDFFIGYTAEMPRETAKLLGRVIWIVAISLVVLGGLLVANQRGFSLGIYELGKLSTIQGIVTLDPVPSMRVLGAEDAQGVIPSQTIMLMSFGKFGAEEDLEKIASQVKKETGKALNEVLLTLEGTLDYRDGKTLFELSKNEHSLIGIEEQFPDGYQELFPPEFIARGTIIRSGEIVDSKCYFGTMKPGEGKPHRSCAIRCISGGIPPILMVTNPNGEKEAFLLRGPNAEPIGQAVLDIVADPVTITGELVQYDQWNMILVDPATGIQKIDR